MEQTNAEKLRTAKKLIEEVRDTLNLVKRQCECCNLTVYENEKEWVQRQMLNAAMSRVEKVSEEMERTNEVSGV